MPDDVRTVARKNGCKRCGLVSIGLVWYQVSHYFPVYSFAFVIPSVARAFSADMSPGENVVVPLIAQTLEFTLSSPPPLHQFTEPPLVVETDHLDLYPGKEVEEILAAQGHEVTDIVGKEKWTLNDPSKYEGLIPQNVEWTEFVDEKTGEWVYLDEFGDRVQKS